MPTQVGDFLRRWTNHVKSDPAFRYALVVFLVMRVVISLWMALVLAVTRPPTTTDDILRPYQGVEPITGGPAELFLGVWQRFDTLWYTKIASQGYSPNDGSTVYFPLYPFLIRTLGKALLGNYLPAAVLISNVAYVGALVCLYKLTEKQLGRASARRSVVYLAIFPTAFFFLAPYSESLFLFLALAAFLCAERRRWWLSGACGLLCSLTRLQGIVLVVPLLYMYMQDRQWRLRELRPDLLGPFMIPCGAGLFLAYQQLVIGSAPLLTTYQTQLYAQFVWPWENIIATWQKILSVEGTFINVLNLGVACLFLAMTLVSFYRLPRSYSIYMAVSLLVLLLRRTTLQPLVSMSRYVLVLFPAFMIWGCWGRNPRVQRLIVYPSVALLMYLSGQFAMWGWVA